MEKVFEIVKIKQELLEKEGEHYTIRSPYDAVDLFTQEIGEEDREVLMVAMLNAKNDVIALHRCHVGDINSSIVNPREIFKGAILNNAASTIIISHNHPSGSPEASPQDAEVTKKIAQAGRILGIELLDHVIVTHDSKKHYSFKEQRPSLLKM